MVAIDALDLHNVPSGRYKFALICVDLLTGYTICRPTTSLKYPSVLKFFVEAVFPFGIPLTIISDNATSFKNIPWSDFCSRMDINRRYITPYQPSSNGLAERAVRTFKQMASKWCESNQLNWPKILPAVQHAYNVSIKKSHNYSPHFLLFGNAGRLGIEGKHDIPDGYKPLESLSPITRDESLETFLYRIKQHRDEALKRLIETGKKWKGRYDVNRRLALFKVGDKVVRRIGRLPQGTSHSFFCKYSTPYTVSRVVNDLVVEILDNNGNKMTVHVDQLKGYEERELDADLLRLKNLRDKYNKGLDLMDEETEEVLPDELLIEEDDNQTIIYGDGSSDTEVDTSDHELVPDHPEVPLTKKRLKTKRTRKKKQKQTSPKDLSERDMTLPSLEEKDSENKTSVPLPTRHQTRSRTGVKVKAPDRLNLSLLGSHHASA